MPLGPTHLHLQEFTSLPGCYLVNEKCSEITLRFWTDILVSISLSLVEPRDTPFYCISISVCMVVCVSVHVCVYVCVCVCVCVSLLRRVWKH